jgi:hypothetical protein
MTCAVLNSSGTTFQVPLTVLNSAGLGFLVSGVALNSAGTPFTWCTTEVEQLNAGGASRERRKRHKTQAQTEDETFLMGFVKDYLSKYI